MMRLFAPVKTALLPKAVFVVMLAACVVVVGCGGGGGRTTGTAFYGSIEGNVFVPGDRSGAAPAVDRGAPPAGYSALGGAAVSATVGSETRTATTDANGHFVVSGLPVGRASIRIVPPTGESFRDFTALVDVAAGTTTTIGSDGDISLLSRTVAVLEVTVDSVDVSAWPTVRAHVSVLDPQADAAVIGMAVADFALVLNGATANVSGITTEMSAGAKPHRVYVLSAAASGANPGFARAEINAGFCDRTGAASGYSSTPTAFISPIPGATVAFAFKDARYAAVIPGKWHMGADLPANVNTRVNAVAVGEVTAVIVSGQDTGVVVLHKVSADIATAAGATRDVYVLYGCTAPSVAVGATVEPGQAIGNLRSHTDGSRLHLGLRVGDSILSAWGDGNLVGGLIPAADAFGLTDGWTDPIEFLADKTPDNTWTP